MQKWEYMHLEMSQNDLNGEVEGFENGEPNLEHQELYIDWMMQDGVVCWNYWGQKGWELIDQKMQNTEVGYFVVYIFKRMLE